MAVLRLDDLQQYSDVLHAKSGETVTLRFVEPRDAETIQSYFRGLSTRSRYNRFFGAVSQLPPALLERFIHVGEADQFSVVATMQIDGRETVIGEARYAVDFQTSSFEFALSVDDRWQGHGIGTAMMKNLECRAAAFGAMNLYGDTLRSNEAMLAVAKKTGYVFGNIPGDWKLVRFSKQISVASHEIPCASWRLLARAA